VLRRTPLQCPTCPRILASGVSRTYNGVPRENYFHAGLDYGAPQVNPTPYTVNLKP